MKTYLLITALSIVLSGCATDSRYIAYDSPLYGPHGESLTYNHYQDIRTHDEVHYYSDRYGREADQHNADNTIKNIKFN